VVLVSPSLLMLAIQVMQQILKDARMRDAGRTRSAPKCSTSATISAACAIAC